MIRLKRINSVEHIFVFTVTFILLIRFVLFIEANSVNILFWDQWDFLDKLFDNNFDIWKAFSHQHGPHRQGLGGILLNFIYPVSGWNVRYEVFISVGITSISCFIALLTKYKIFGRLSWSDIAIPSTYLTLFQYENFIGTPNPAHGPIPTLLITLTAFCLTINRLPIKASCLTILVFLTTYTGFAIFSAIPILMLLTYKTLKTQPMRDRYVYGIATIVSLLAFLSFFIGYHRNSSAADCFKFPHDQPWQYLEFVTLLFGRSWGLFNFPGNNELVGIKVAISVLLTLFLIISIAFSLSRIWKFPNQQKSELSELIFYLASFTLIFAVFTAIGRVCFGVGASLSSRYVPYCIPGIMALYFFCLELMESRKFNQYIKYGILVAIVSLVSLKELNIVGDYSTIDWYRNGKISWSNCYLQTKNVMLCDQKTNFKVYPEASRIEPKLKFLEENNLSFFRSKKNKK